jgi:hypothetical protein
MGGNVHAPNVPDNKRKNTLTRVSANNSDAKF